MALGPEAEAETEGGSVGGENAGGEPPTQQQKTADNNSDKSYVIGQGLLRELIPSVEESDELFERSIASGGGGDPAAGGVGRRVGRRPLGEAAAAAAASDDALSPSRKKQRGGRKGDALSPLWPDIRLRCSARSAFRP